MGREDGPGLSALCHRMGAHVEEPSSAKHRVTHCKGVAFHGRSKRSNNRAKDLFHLYLVHLLRPGQDRGARAPTGVWRCTPECSQWSGGPILQLLFTHHNFRRIVVLFL